MFLEHQETAGAGWVVSLNSAQNCFKTVLVQPDKLFQQDFWVCKRL